MHALYTDKIIKSHGKNNFTLYCHFKPLDYTLKGKMTVVKAGWYEKLN